MGEKVAEVFEKDTSGDGAIFHGYTYSAHPVGAAAVVACLSETQRLTQSQMPQRGERNYMKAS